MSGLRTIRSAVATCTTVVALLLGVVVCTTAAVSAEAGAVLAAARAASTVANPDCRSLLRFNRAKFPRRPKIDNRFFPLVPGRNIVMSGTVLDEDGTLHVHKIVTTVTSVTKVLDGVRTLVVFDRDFQDGQLQESELAFEAQDRSGTVWNVGEYPEEYEDKALAGAPSTWISGIDHAKAGVSMLAHPRVRTPAYLQGVSPSVDFRDCGKVSQTGLRLSVQGHCYQKVVVIDEWAPLDPEGGHQLKYYAPGVGSIRVAAAGGANQEVLNLTSFTKLSKAALAKVNAQVLKQDRRGYRISPDVYGQTPRAVINSGLVRRR
jgi:hypothetical protein